MSVNVVTQMPHLLDVSVESCSRVKADGACMQVRAIFRVANPRLWVAYAQRCQEIAEDLSAGAPSI